MRASSITIQAFLISLCLFVAALIIAGIYTTQKQRPLSEESIASIFLEPQDKVSTDQRPPEIKEIVKPTPPEELPTPAEDMQITPRLASAEVVMTARAATSTLLEFSSTPVKHDLRINPNVPKVRVIPTVIADDTSSKIGSRGRMLFSTSVTVPPTTRTRRDVADRYIGESMKLRKDRPIICGAPARLPDVEHKIAVRVGSKWREVKPLSKGEPGGCVLGRGKDIRGVFRLVRLRHDLADWWADQSSLVALTHWLNTQTKIKTDMNVEGGAIRLTDPKLSKAPLVFCTGHDSSLVISRELAYGAPLRGRLSKPERDGLRQYLINDGGFVFFDDCGVNAPAQAFLRLVLAQLRYAMPEYSVDRIPNHHEIYNNYYDMSGPPVGYDIFWWGTHPPKRNFLEGITIGDHLGVLVSGRDYMCALRTISAPSWPAHYSPSVLRFSTNVVIYALTHGGISDYSHYIPEDSSDDSIPISKPVVVPEFQ